MLWIFRKNFDSTLQIRQKEIGGGGGGGGGIEHELHKLLIIHIENLGSFLARSATQVYRYSDTNPIGVKKSFKIDLGIFSLFYLHS